MLDLAKEGLYIGLDPSACKDSEGFAHKIASNKQGSNDQVEEPAWFAN